MTDHAQDIRRQFIDDYAARVRLPQTEQRAGWLEYLRSTGKLATMRTGKNWSDPPSVLTKKEPK